MRLHRAVSTLLLLALVSLGALAQSAPDKITEGSLQFFGKKNVSGFCPLQRTEVKAGLSGFLGRVTVTQHFVNPTDGAIEAVYVFPLPNDAAVDDMVMTVAGRTIRGLIKPRDEAEKIYAAARARGEAASLLDQERPNIFTQSVANIPPGASIDIQISYFEVLKYDRGAYEFRFPMVVGPRYIPGAQLVTDEAGNPVGTNKVPDAGKITPPVTLRAAHDVTIEVALDAGVPVTEVSSPSHDIDFTRTSASGGTVTLKNDSAIPNKDFILRYRTAGAQIQEATMFHADGHGGGTFAMILQPPERVYDVDVVPKEVVFVLDTSGSMDGFPEEKAKELIMLGLNGLGPNDTFNVIRFSGDTQVLFAQPQYASATNVARAKSFVEQDWGHGGTEMMKAITTALAPSDSQDHVRIVMFLTDGFVGNDLEIIGEVRKHPNARVFAFGIGSSVNHYLLDNMAREGRGEVEYVGLNDDGSAAAQRFWQRVRSPLMTDVKVDFGGLPVTDVFPARIPDLFDAKPLVIVGRYTGAASGTVRITGTRAGGPMVREVPVSFPKGSDGFDAIGAFWARQKIDSLMAPHLEEIQNGNPPKEMVAEVTKLGLQYRLMTQWTSFVAVEEKVVTKGGVTQTIEVPVQVPEGSFGTDCETCDAAVTRSGGSPKAAKAKVGRGGVGAGSGGGVYGGIASPSAIPTAPPPPLNQAAQAPALSSEAVEVDATPDAGTIPVLTSSGTVPVNTSTGAATVPVNGVEEPKVKAPPKETVPKDPQRATLEGKLQPRLLELYDCMQANNCKDGGSSTVKIVIIGKIDADALRALGFQGEIKDKQATGTLDVAKLADLVRLDWVKFVALQA